MAQRGRSTARDGFANEVEFFVLTHFKGFWGWVQSNDRLRSWVNGILINRAISKIPPRPLPLSTLSDYTSWRSLTDRSYSGRHLPPAKADPATRPDPVTLLSELFERKTPRMSDKSTLLFPYFAQWFTDGFLRTAQDARGRSIKNNSNHQVDLCQVYGLTEAVADRLRSHQGGKLKSQVINGEVYPPYYYEGGRIKPEFADELGRPVVPEPLFVDNLEHYSRYLQGAPEPQRKLFERILASIVPPGWSQELHDRRKDQLFAMGVERANAQIGYMMMNVLFLREHNRVCDVLAQAYPSWDDERLFQTTRNIMIVLLLKIVIEEYINHITPYHFRFVLDAAPFMQARWHRENWMSVEFSLVYRWHSLIPDHVEIAGQKLPMTESLVNTEVLAEHGLAAWFESTSLQQACDIGMMNTPLFLLGTDWGSIKVDRDARLTTYNDYREMAGFPRVTSFDQITGDKARQQKLKEIYGHVDKIEMYVGCYAEDTREGSALSSLIGRIVGIDAFSQALTNPLLSDSIFTEATFSPAGMEIITSTSTLSDMLHRNIPPTSRRYTVTMTRPL
jgi:prostaglandin-endoperoxide synthase 2